jgi:hypothetical protein
MMIRFPHVIMWWLYQSRLILSASSTISSSTCCSEMTAATVRLYVLKTSTWLIELVPFEFCFGKGDFC